MRNLKFKFENNDVVLSILYFCNKVLIFMTYTPKWMWRSYDPQNKTKYYHLYQIIHSNLARNHVKYYCVVRCTASNIKTFTSYQCLNLSFVLLTHWSRVTHIYVSKLTIIASDNGLSPGRRQAIIWTNAGILLIGPLGLNFSEILIES